MPSARKQLGGFEIRVCGDDLLSIVLDDPEEAAPLAETLRSELHALEIVPGIDTVGVQFDASVVDSDEAERQVNAVIAQGIEPIELSDTLIEIPVVYGGKYGPDFDDVCAATGLDVDELIALHTGTEYVVELVGFTPGFAFVGGLDERLNVPRRAEPRQKVPAGSVGIADSRTGLYALPVPGGWSLIGRTNAPLFDPKADPVNLLQVGSRVRFVSVSAGDLGW